MIKKLTVATLLCASQSILATDLIRSGSSAATMGSGGVTGLSQDALTSLSSNPAYLASLENSNQVSVAALLVDSEFTSSLGETVAADSGPGIFPEFALSRRVADTPWTWGAGANVLSAMRADFQFADPIGASGVSYGHQTHRSEFVVVKLSAGVAYRISNALSIGASMGVAYNRNQLKAPYIFQSSPTLRGFKILADLDADDFALTTSVGINYQLNSDWQFNIAYNPEVSFSANGELIGDLAQLGLGIPQAFAYNANVKTALPTTLIAGLTWQASDRLQLGVQYDSIGWQKSFDTLPIRLTNGSNQELNRLVGDDFIEDTAPLNWDNQRAVHVGTVYTTKRGRTFRAGLENSNVPPPRSTLTPLTGAILDTVYSLGFDFPVAGAKVDFAYRYSVGSDTRVINSDLLAGEYSNSELSLKLHSVILSLSF